MKRRAVLFILLLASALAHAQERIRDVTYLHEGDASFTMDVFKPKTASGKAIMWIVSGGWFSSRDNINPDLAKVFTDRGYTVFEVVHGTQPKFLIPQIIKQLTHAVRFIRANAATYGVDPSSIGVSGASSGGHLTLMLAGTGNDGDKGARDPIDRVSSRLNAAVAFMPPTDFLNWGGDGLVPFKIPIMQIFMPAFGVNTHTPEAELKKLGHDLSPITYVKSGYPPTLLVHGDADMLVPVQQSKRMDAAFAAAGVEHKLVIVPGGDHGGKTLAGGAQATFAWFDVHLPGLPSATK